MRWSPWLRRTPAAMSIETSRCPRPSSWSISYNDRARSSGRARSPMSSSPDRSKRCASSLGKRCTAMPLLIVISPAPRKRLSHSTPLVRASRRMAGAALALGATCSLRLARVSGSSWRQMSPSTKLRKAHFENLVRRSSAALQAEGGAMSKAQRNSTGSLPQGPTARILRAGEAEAWRNGYGFLAEASRTSEQIRQAAHAAYSAEHARGYADGRAEGAAEATRLLSETMIKIDRHFAT